MNEHAKNLRRTRADMLGTDDEKHYWDCHAAAAEIDRLEDKIAKLEAVIDTLHAGLENKHKEESQ
jgi:hypothetical protein